MFVKSVGSFSSNFWETVLVLIKSRIYLINNESKIFVVIYYFVLEAGPSHGLSLTFIMSCF